MNYIVNDQNVMTFWCFATSVVNTLWTSLICLHAQWRIDDVAGSIEIINIKISSNFKL